MKYEYFTGFKPVHHIFQKRYRLVSMAVLRRTLPSPLGNMKNIQFSDGICRVCNRKLYEHGVTKGNRVVCPNTYLLQHDGIVFQFAAEHEMEAFIKERENEKSAQEICVTKKSPPDQFRRAQ